MVVTHEHLGIEQEAVKQRVEDLEFQLQQQQNAVIGRGGPAFPVKKGSD